MSPRPDAVIVGAGIVGAACAYYASQAGLRVLVLDRTAVAAGTTGAGEGNILLSDKTPGPELELAQRSVALWHQLGEQLDADFELDIKGGVVVTPTESGLAALGALAAEQRQHGVQADLLDPAALAELEPQLAPDQAGGAWYPQDLQVQPMLAAARLLAAAQQHGAELQLGVTVTGSRIAGDRLVGLSTDRGPIDCGAVVNAAGTWAGELSARLRAEIPVRPRRGFVLVTEPLPPLIRHKVYSADYVANVASSSAGLETSAVVEGTRAGTVLIGASRERVGFDRQVSEPVIRQLAAQAVELFPALADVQLIRVYRGFRPYCPDHLPVIGSDERVPGILHAAGHEGAGIGLAPATGELIAGLLTGAPTAVDPTPFRPNRFPADAPVDRSSADDSAVRSA